MPRMKILNAVEQEAFESPPLFTASSAKPILISRWPYATSRRACMHPSISSAFY